MRLDTNGQEDEGAYDEEEEENEKEGFMTKAMWKEAREYVCPVIVGTCGSHYFHVHCLHPWWKRFQTCPLCGERWQTSALVLSTVRWKDVQEAQKKMVINT